MLTGLADNPNGFLIWLQTEFKTDTKDPKLRSLTELLELNFFDWKL